jgi:predicted  nucleic acid-binding Zn-ribbon protein
MSVDKINKKIEVGQTTGVDITWERLIDDSQNEIDACKERITKLHKSIDFFMKQASLGIRFPRLDHKT